jgi:hypothetical protein
MTDFSVEELEIDELPERDAMLLGLANVFALVSVSTILGGALGLVVAL